MKNSSITGLVRPSIATPAHQIYKGYQDNRAQAGYQNRFDIEAVDVIAPILPGNSRHYYSTQNGSDHPDYNSHAATSPVVKAPGNRITNDPGQQAHS
jgi:hypothetical protein